MECRLRALKACPPSEELLERHLNSLPDTLYETYERMLEDLPAPDYTQRMLRVLCGAMRPLTIEELIDAIAIVGTNPPRFDMKSRLKDLDAIQDVCPGLIELNRDLAIDKVIGCVCQGPITVSLGHFSVQEYLESERICQRQSVACFAINPRKSHTRMARICLTFLLEPKVLRDEDPLEILSKFPFFGYAAHYWPNHFGLAENKDLLMGQVLRLFRNERRSFEIWRKIYNSGGTMRIMEIPPSPIYCASFFGLDSLLVELMGENRSSLPSLLNEPMGHWGSALGAAVFMDEGNTVQVLLENGADANTTVPNFAWHLSRSALYHALRHGRLRIAQLLIDGGADVSAKNQDGRTLLHIVSMGDRAETTEFLLANGVDVNAKDKDGQTALHLAVSYANAKAVRLLLAENADIDAQDKYGQTALHLAGSVLDNTEVELSELLIQNGASLHLKTILGLTPLQVPSSRNWPLRNHAPHPHVRRRAS